MEYKLSELVNLKYGKSQKEVASPHGKYPIMGTGGIIGYASDFLYDKPSVLIGRKGSIQNVFYIDEPFWTIDTLFYTEINESKVIPRYLFYKFKTMDLMNYNEGTTIPSLRTQTLNEISLNVSDLNQQKRIVEILYNYDQKIELNNKIIANLEAQAQAIFKSWFIDFEPFQDGEFVESELGLIPEGWGVKSLDKIANYKNGLAMQKFPPENDLESLPVLKIQELRKNSTDESSDRCSSKISEDVKVYDGDIIFSWSATLMVKVWTGGNAGLNQHLFKVTSDVYDKWFYYLWTSYHLKRFQAIARDKATTMGHIKRSHLKEALTLAPDSSTYCEMSKLMNPIIEMIVNLGVQNRTLAQVRDTLLPKLMSGEIDVSTIKINPEEICHV